MVTRADRILEILKKAGGRLRVNQITQELAGLEGVASLHPSVVSATVTQDNCTLDAKGRTPRFNTYGDGNEQWGFVSVREAPAAKEVTDLSKYHDKVPAIIEGANRRVRDALKKAIRDLGWQEFETNFLTQVLEALGFNAIEVTQPTRDGGMDAVCRYQRGIVTSEAIVSAKHWTSKRVGVEEVQRLRGLKGNADTGVIVTSSHFTGDAQREAEPSQNQRAVVLVDGDLIVDTCLANSIGVRRTSLPTLYEFVGFEVPSEAQ